MPAPTLDEIARLEGLHDEAQQQMREFLYKRGWLYTSQTPGCIWMWERKLDDGRTLLVDTSTALACERQLCGEEYDESEIKEF